MRAGSGTHRCVALYLADKRYIPTGGSGVSLYDVWQGEPAPVRKAIFAMQDYDGMADAALDHLFAALAGEKQLCPVALPIADYQVRNGRF